MEAKHTCRCKPATRPLYKDLGPSVRTMVLMVPNTPLYRMPATAAFSPWIWGHRLYSALLVVNVRKRFFCRCRRTGTWSLTLAVSRGNVTMSAMQAAAPALAIFTPSGGGTSDGLSPTMISAPGMTLCTTHGRSVNRARTRCPLTSRANH